MMVKVPNTQTVVVFRFCCAGLMVTVSVEGLWSLIGGWSLLLTALKRLQIM